MTTEHDYNECPENADGRHDPRPAPVADPDMPPGYFTVECSRCYQTTGYPFPDDPDEIEW